ncbi:MAG: SRPBCC family protein [Anaerolineae bacterium]|nr:SRPBCC family protein [Anaerolineae bacterium]
MTNSESANQVSVPHNKGIRVDKSITINRPVEEIYKFWRNFENLPHFMHHLKSVRVTDDLHSHWIARAPAGSSVEWDAEIINEVPNERIGWRSLEGSEVANAGSVVFKPAPGGRGTELQVSLKYDPPGGKIGATIAKLFGKEPSVQIQEDLHRLQQLLETGEISTATGQTSGREKGEDLEEQAAQNPTSIQSNVR